MLAFLAAVVIGVDLLFDPSTSVALWEVGLLLVALHLALGPVLSGWWQRG